MLERYFAFRMASTSYDFELFCSMVSLAEMFELPPTVVHSIVSKMIINEELQVSDAAFLA